MSAPRLPSLRSAGGHHLLRLVRDASLGLPSTSKAGAIWATRSLSLSAKPQRSNTAALKQMRQVRMTADASASRSYGAAAYALAEPEYHSAPQDPIIHHPPSTARQPFQPVLEPPEWTQLPHSLQLLLQSNPTPSDIRAEFEASKSVPCHLARVSTLEAVWPIWLDQAEPSTWAWLAGQLGNVLALKSVAELEQGLVPLAQSIRGYAMARLGQKREANALLGDIKRSKTRGGVLAAMVQAMAWVDLGSWADAGRPFGAGVRQMVGSARAEVRSDLSLDMLDQLVNAYRQDGKVVELLDVAVSVGGPLRTLLLSGSESRALRKGDARMVRIWLGALQEVPDPAGWLEGRLDGSNRDTRWMGAVLLAALSRDISHLDRCGELFHLITDEQLPLPSGVAVKLLSAMTAAADHDGAARVVQHLQTDLASLPHSALSAVLEHASRNFDVLEVRRTWSVLTKRFDPTSRDKTNFLRRTLELHNPEVADTQLRQFFGWVDHPDALSLLLTAHIAANDIPSARDVFDKLMAVRPSVTIVNKMLGMYAANVNADPAVELFDGMADFGLTPNIASYTSLIALFANTRDAENARNVFGLMEDSGIRPDASAYSAVLNAEVEAGEWLEAAKRWDGIPNHLQNVPDVVSVILKAYILLSIPTQRVIEIFRRIERPTSYLWSLAMQSAVDNDEIPLAYQLLSEMDDAAAASSRAPQPSVYHFSILLHGYMRTGRRREARETYDDMLERGIIPSSVTYGMIMGAFKKIEGSSGLEQATQFAESLDTTAWHIRGAARGRAAARENMYGPLVSMSGASGQVGRAEEYLELAAEEPTLPLYTRLMDAYRQAGRTDSVMAIWEKAFELACVTSRQTASDLLGGKPTSRARDNLLCMPLSIVLDALASAGRYLDVRRVWDSVQKAGFGFDAQNYNHYATALARMGDVDRAFSIVENILLPRWEEIKKRRVVAMRETAFGLLPPPEEAPAVEDVPTSPPARTNNRRHEERYSVGALLTDPSRARGSIDSGVLRHWRPSDVLWRPSLLTLSVLEHAYSQLQDLNRGAWMALGGSEEDADAEAGAGEVALRRFGGAPIRDVDGEVKKTTPRAVLFRLNRKYTKVVALVMFHRRQRSAKKSS